jgi:hypothetical protein
LLFLCPSSLAVAVPSSSIVLSHSSLMSIQTVINILPLSLL